jgi:hypothetical protein
VWTAWRRHGCRRGAGAEPPEKVSRAEWTKEAAQDALAARMLARDAPKAPATVLTLGQAAARYLTAKARKRSLGDDARYLDAFKVAFGR